MLAGIPRSCFLVTVLATAACGNTPVGSGVGGPSRGGGDPSLATTDANNGKDEGAAPTDGGSPPPTDSAPPPPIDSGWDTVAGNDSGTVIVSGGDGGATDSASASDGPPAEAVCPAEPAYTGVLLGFAGGPNFGLGLGIGQCGFPNDKLPAGRFYGAVDSVRFGQAAACGACLRIESMDGKLTADIEIIDRVDLLPPGFGPAVSADIAVHLMFGHGDNPTVRFRFVPCDVSGNIQVQLDATTTLGSSLMVMNHRTALGGVQVATAAGWRALGRTTFNRWPIPFVVNGVKNSLRFFDSAGHSVDAADVPFVAGLQETGAQFPPCSETAQATARIPAKR